MRNFKFTLISFIFIGTAAIHTNIAKAETSNGIHFAYVNPFTLFEQLSSPAFAQFNPKIDIVETSSMYTVTADMPGIAAEDIIVTLDNNILTIEGQKEIEAKKEEDEDEDKNKRVYKQERFLGAFSRQVYLPDSIDPDQIAAENKDGVLTINIAKKESSKPRTIEIKS
ncbi:MAG: Hsp20/alpha crystallin family protein [Gammaproteobacteria bacterium]